MQQNVDILEIEVLHEILLTNTLAPVTTSAAFETISKPQALVCDIVSVCILCEYGRELRWHTIVTIRPSSTSAVVIILMKETSTARITLRNSLFIGSSIHLNTRGIALQQTLILDSPSDHIDIHRLVREPVEPGQFTNPLVE